MARTFKVRDLRNGSWYWVNTAVNACTHISSADKCIYGALASFGGCEEIRPPFEILAERSGTSVRQAKKSVRKLIDAGIVEIKQGGGRGIANVYDLLKADKGCKKCTVYKGCIKEQETVQELHLKGANSAPQVDKIYKEVDNAETSSAKDNQSNLSSEVIKAFEVVDPKNKTYYANKTQRAASEFLIKEYGFEEVLKRVSVLPRTNKIKYFPTITSPYELKEKWVKLQDEVQKKRQETIKNKVAFY